MLDRLRSSTGSRFFGPGMGVRKSAKMIKTSGSAKYLRQKIRDKLDAIERANLRDDRENGDRDKKKVKQQSKKKNKGKKTR